MIHFTLNQIQYEHTEHVFYSLVSLIFNYIPQKNILYFLLYRQNISIFNMSGTH